MGPQDIDDSEQQVAELQSQAEDTQDTGGARAYVSAIGGLFEGDSVSAQAAAVKQELHGISDSCAGALGGS